MNNKEDKKIFEEFVTGLLINQKPLNGEFSKIVDEHFWELI